MSLVDSADAVIMVSRPSDDVVLLRMEFAPRATLLAVHCVAAAEVEHAVGHRDIMV